MEMRKAFSSCLKEAMANDSRICVLDADLASSNGTFSLRKDYPDRAFDVGIAEQNMVSIAAGMASYGYIPFVTTFACFASRRVCDQIAISCAYAKQNVKIVGTDPGITAELNGGTHMAIEDIGVLRSIPNLLIFEPCDERELIAAMPALINHSGPVYMRLQRKDVPDIHDDEYKFDLYKADILKEGSDITLFSSGPVMTGYALQAAKELKQEGISAELINVHTIKPLDKETIGKSLMKTGAAVTCENHSIIGGLHSAICEFAAEDCPVPVQAIGFQDVCGEVGTANELAAKKGLLASDIVAAAKKALARK